ncbi:MAG TPA: glycosyltransferase family 9 protein [Tepidisphaeraceae bacterium]|nr:glycosyltransferase family 9 protein [Tepidisphaeraceae bacterium]
MRVFASNPDTLGDLLLRQPMYAAMIEQGHELLLAVRRHLIDFAADLIPGAVLTPIDGEPYVLAIQPQPGAFDPLLKRAIDFNPEIFLVAPYQWTLLEEWLAANLTSARAIGMRGSLYPGDPAWGVSSVSTLRFSEQAEVSQDTAELEKNKALARLILGEKASSNAPKICPTAQGMADAQGELAKLGFAGKEYWIALVGHAADKQVRNWSLENWSATLRHWATKFGRRFLFIGSEEECQATQEVIGNLGDVPPESIALYCRNGSLRTLSGLIQLSQGYVGRDTGPMHMAAALGKPIIAVFGGGTWPRFVPAAETFWVGTVSVPCAGCLWQCAFDQSYCIKQVPAAEVCSAIDDFESGRLQGRAARIFEPTEAIWKSMIAQTPANSQAGMRKIALAARGELDRRVDELARHLESSEADRAARLRVIEQQGREFSQVQVEFDSYIKEMDRRLAESEADRAARLRVIEEQGRELSRVEGEFDSYIKEMDRRLDESEADRAARLEVINNQGRDISGLHAQIHELLQNTERLQQDFSKRQADLEQALSASEADRAAGLEIIDQQGTKIARLESDRAGAIALRDAVGQELKILTDQMRRLQITLQTVRSSSAYRLLHRLGFWSSVDHVLGQRPSVNNEVPPQT